MSFFHSTTVGPVEPSTRAYKRNSLPSGVVLTPLIGVSVVKASFTLLSIEQFCAATVLIWEPANSRLAAMLGMWDSLILPMSLMER